MTKRLLKKVIPFQSQPRLYRGPNHNQLQIPKPDFLYNAASGPFNLCNGNIFGNTTGQPVVTQTKSGVAHKVWRGHVAVTEAPISGIDAIMCIFRMNTPSTDGVILCGSGGIYGPQLRMVSGVLQYRPPATGSANVPASTTMTAGEVYVAFGYSWSTSSTDREIWVNGQNASGTKTGTGITTAINRACVGENPSFVVVTPDADIIMGAIWKNYRFNEEQARWISNNPWSLFEPVKRKFFIDLGLTPVQNDSIHLWNISENISQDSNVYWDVVNDVVSDSTELWNVKQNVQNDSIVNWNVYANVLQDCVIDWSLAGLITSDSNINWNVKQNIQNDSVSLWNITNRVVTDSNLLWNLIQKISSDSTSRWNITQNISNNLSNIYNIYNYIQNDSSINWGVLNSVQNDSTYLWNLKQNIASDINLIWSFGSFVTKDYELNWDQISGVEKSLDLAYKIINNIESDLALQWRVINTAENSFTLRWNVVSELSYEDIPTGTVTFIIQDDKITFQDNNTITF